MDAEVIADLDGINFSKVLYIVTLDSKYTRAPTLEILEQRTKNMDAKVIADLGSSGLRFRVQ